MIKFQISDPKQKSKDKTQESYFHNLEKRTFEFAKNVRDFLHLIPRSNANFQYSNQLLRSSGSVGANYIEANEALSKKTLNTELKFVSRKLKSHGTGCFYLKLMETGRIISV